MLKAPQVARSIGRYRAHALAAIVLMVWGCPPTPPPQPESFFINLVECPHDWGDELRFPDSVVTPGQFVLPGATTNVPEFHDCQKLVVFNGTDLEYGRIAAVFGAWDNAARWDSLRAHPVSFFADPVTIGRVSGLLATTTAVSTVQTPAVPAGAPQQSNDQRSAWGFLEIVSEGAYAPLGIGEGFNCVYLYGAGNTLQAKTVHYPGFSEPDCAEPIDPASVEGTVLAVTPTVHGVYRAGDDYPAAARWDWDPVNQIHYVGVKCGAAWCEIGPVGMTLSSVPAGASPGVPRVRQIKGWFDQQQLAPPDLTDPKTPHPGWGTVFPSQDLGDFVRASFRGQWREVASVALDSSLQGYAKKLNLFPAFTDGVMNQVYLCHGDFALCAGGVNTIPGVADRLPALTAPNCSPVPDLLPEDTNTWWAAIVPPVEPVAFRCVIRRDHTKAFQGLSVPGYVRWRWRNDDETIWIRCDQGCCEVEGPGG